MTESSDRFSLGIPRHSHLLDWIEEHKTNQGFDTLSDYFNSIKTDIEEALTLIDAVERFSPSSISQLLQVSKDKNFPIPVMIHQDQKITYINHAAEDMAGVKFNDNVLGQSIFSYLPLADHPKMRERMEKLMETGLSADPVKQIILLPGGGEIEVMMYGFLTSYNAQPAIQFLFWGLEGDLRELREKQEQLRISECLNDALILLISDDREESLIPEALRMICQGFRADTVKLFQVYEEADGTLGANDLYEWDEQQKKAVADNPQYQNFAFEKMGLGRWPEILASGACVGGPTHILPESEKQLFESVNIKSVMAAPVLINKQLWGFIAVDEYKSARYWSSFEQSVLRSFGLAIAGYLQRRESANRALTAEKAMHKAQEIGGVSSFSFDLESGDWYFSRAFIKTFGVFPRRTDLFQKKMLDYIPREDYARLVKVWDKSLRATTPVRSSGEFMFQQEDQELFFTFLIESLPESGKIHGVFRDVTDSRVANQGMLDSKEKLERTQKIGKVGFWEYDMSTGNAWWSDILYDMMDVEENEGVNPYSLTQTSILESDLEELVYKSRNAVEALQPLDFVQRLRLKNGKTMFFEVYGELIMDDHGNLVRLSGTCRDITEREAAMEKVKTSEGSLAAILESTSDLILSLDQEFRIIAYNSSLYYLIEQWIGEKISVGSDLSEILTHRQRESRVRGQMSTLRKAMAGESVEGRLTVPGAHGEIIHYTLTLNPILGEHGEVTGVSVFGRDVTERIQKEREIKALNTFLERRVASRTQELEKINRELEAFAYSVSHDLRTPLRHLSGYSTLLMTRGGEKLDAESRQYLDFIGSSSRKMNDLIEDLLEYSRLGRKTIHPLEIDLNDIARGIVYYFREQENLSMDVFETKFEAKIYADPVLTETVLTNLVSNAVKYRKKDASPKVRITSKAVAEGVEVTVSDEGIGFDMKYVDQVFGIFKRLHSDEEYEGSGIGLANVVRIMHRHGGSIEAVSDPGVGTTFTCFFPHKKSS